MDKIILASSSSSRKGILLNAGIEFESMDPAIDEVSEKQLLLRKRLSPSEISLALASAKALSISSKEHNRIVIGADQVLSLETQQFDKPRNLEEALSQLKILKGKTHHLETATVVAINDKIVWFHLDRPAMTMRCFTENFLVRYLEKIGEEVHQTVGGYKIESIGVQLFSKVEGDYFSILGLSLLPLLEFLRTIEVNGYLR